MSQESGVRKESELRPLSERDGRGEPRGTAGRSSFVAPRGSQNPQGDRSAPVFSLADSPSMANQFGAVQCLAAAPFEDQVRREVRDLLITAPDVVAERPIGQPSLKVDDAAVIPQDIARLRPVE